jgi:hypothetical protein
LSAAAVDWRRERTRPFHHRRVKMGVRDSDGIDAAETFDHRQSRVVARKRCNPTLPSSVRTSGALTDSEWRRPTDADDVLLVFAEGIGVGLSQYLKCSPGLSAGRDVLALLLADHAMNRRLRTLGVLRAT